MNQPFEVGDFVTYVTPYEKQHGRVKSLSDDQHVFVVYHCEDNWDDYTNYTGQRTRIVDLIKGWEKE